VIAHPRPKVPDESIKAKIGLENPLSAPGTSPFQSLRSAVSVVGVFMKPRKPLLSAPLNVSVAVSYTQRLVTPVSPLTATSMPRLPIRPRIKLKTLNTSTEMPRYPTLDGWRGISILLVMAGHLIPLGPSHLHINAIAATLGMAIFFTLSGFLITTTLLYRPKVTEFLIRRFCRVVPLAFVFTLFALATARAPFSYFAAQIFFYSNLPPFWLTAHTGHLWSLCVEMHFYVAIAVICFFFGRRGLWSIPILCLMVTAYRIETHTLLSIVTILRVDEILAGGALALVCVSPHLAPLRKFLAWLSPLALIPFAIVSSNQVGGSMNYLRPYLVACMVGSTLFNNRGLGVSRLLHAKSLVYLAEISYALYIFHPMVEWGWLGSGSKVIRYAKRVPELVGIFGLAHLSSFRFEQYWIRKGRQWSQTKVLEPTVEQSASPLISKTAA
jgi:peptidoglycan/LPS O-acetylase OafA/YrhL